MDTWIKLMKNFNTTTTKNTMHTVDNTSVHSPASGLLLSFTLSVFVGLISFMSESWFVPL